MRYIPKSRTNKTEKTGGLITTTIVRRFDYFFKALCRRTPPLLYVLAAFVCMYACVCLGSKPNLNSARTQHTQLLTKYSTTVVVLF